MKSMAKRFVLGGILVALPVVAAAQAAAPLEERIARLERLLNSDTLIELLQRVERLHKEVQELRGEVEVQTHGATQIKQRQRELYLDMDRRLTNLESGGGAAVASAPESTTEPATTQPSASESGDEATLASAASSEASTQGQAEAATGLGATDTIAEQNSYQTAFNLLKAGRYEQAGDAFKQFLNEYPRGKYSDNAQYWLGEAYYVTRQFDPAINAFNTLLERYPDSPKLTHAMLKIGYIQDELGQCTEAEQTLNRLVEKFPQSTAARLAQDRLQRLRSGGCAG